MTSTREKYLKSVILSNGTFDFWSGKGFELVLYFKISGILNDEWEERNWENPLIS